MAVDIQLIKGLNEITDHAAQEKYADNTIVQHFEQPMANVVIRTEYFLLRESFEFPFRKNPLPCLEFTYTVSGDTVLSLRNGPGDWRRIPIPGGVRFLGYNTEFSGIATANARVPIKVFHLYITPQKLAQLMGPGNGQLVRTIIDKAGTSSNGLLNMATIDPVTASIIHQIFTRNSASSADPLFIKGKILELLAHEVELLCSPPHKQTLLQPDDVVKLQTAGTIMMKQMSTPPTIAELARKVGLNEKKIKQGFKEFYGNTVYGFLRDHRMAQAKLMFDRDQKSVTEVACAVGYSNVSHFGVIFRHHHGIKPGKYLKSLKKNRLMRHPCR